MNLKEELESLRTEINYFDVIKEKFHKGMISIDEAIDYNLYLFQRKSRFVDIYYRNKREYSSLGFRPNDFYNLLDY